MAESQSNVLLWFKSLKVYAGVSMHFVKYVEYLSGYKLLLTFEDGNIREVDLEPYLDGEVFEPLKDIHYFKTARVNSDLDTLVWDNGTDMAPEFLYEISVPVAKSASVA